MLRKFQPIFRRFAKKLQAGPNLGFSYKKKTCIVQELELMGKQISFGVKVVKFLVFDPFLAETNVFLSIVQELELMGKQI